MRRRTSRMSEEGRATASFKRGEGATVGSRRQGREPTLFRRRPGPPLQREAKAPAPALLRCATALRWRCGCGRAPSAGWFAHEGRGGRGSFLERTPCKPA